ncbi:MAG: hypothetical protein R3F07_11370 [Opitutaceae bacterium]
MPSVDPLIDTNVCFGEWPFGTVGITNAAKLRQRLTAAGIGTALVSHVAPIFNPEPDHGNQRLFTALRKQDDLIAIPVVSPVLRGWEDLLDRYREQQGIRAIKVFPNFHRFSLTGPAMDRLVDYVRSHDLKLMVNIRMVDERHQYFGLKIAGVRVRDLASFSRRHGDFKYLCLGLYRPEILELAEKCGNFLTDFSFADWQYLIEELLGKLPAERIVFGSHTPLMVTQANVDHLRCSGIAKSTMRKIGSANAKRFFGL